MSNDPFKNLILGVRGVEGFSDFIYTDNAFDRPKTVEYLR